MQGIHLIMPMAGGGTRFQDARFAKPKPLIELFGKPFFYWSAQSVLRHANVRTLTFAVLEAHEKTYGICAQIRAFYPTAQFVVIPQVLNGAVLTCLEAVRELDNDLPLVFNDCDHLFSSAAFNAFAAGGRCDFDGALLTFAADSPKFSYVRYDAQGKMIGTVEKQVVSGDAICGTYTLRSRALFERAATAYLDHCNYSEYFMSGVYNEMLAQGQTVRTFPTEFHVSFGTPAEYDAALAQKPLFADF